MECCETGDKLRQRSEPEAWNETPSLLVEWLRRVGETRARSGDADGDDAAEVKCDDNKEKRKYTK